MRTTLDIDNDVLQAVKEIARKDRRSAGRVISDLARRGLKRFPPAHRSKKVVNLDLPTLPSRGELITNEHIQSIMEQEGV